MKSVSKACLVASVFALATAPLLVQAATPAAAPKAAAKTASTAASPRATQAVVRGTSAVSTAPDWLSKPVVKAGYHVPRLSDGHADLEGAWSNVSMTGAARPVTNPLGQPYGDRLIMTPAEVAAAESKAIDKVNYENQPTDPKVGAEDTTNKNCNSLAGGGTGAGGRDCGYNAGWKDTTVRVMRVNGQPRNSFITFPANGRPPAPDVSGNAAANAAAAANLAREATEAEGEGGPGAPARGATTVTVTTADSKTVSGTLERIDDFNVALRDEAGDYHSFDLSGGKLKVEVHDPLRAHIDLLRKYTDADIHNVTAYLETLK